jgi:hypothetical protein
VESRRGMKRAMLEVVAAGVVASSQDVERYLKCRYGQLQQRHCMDGSVCPLLLHMVCCACVGAGSVHADSCSRVRPPLAAIDSQHGHEVAVVCSC